MLRCTLALRDVMRLKRLETDQAAFGSSNFIGSVTWVAKSFATRNKVRLLPQLAISRRACRAVGSGRLFKDLRRTDEAPSRALVCIESRRLLHLEARQWSKGAA